MGSGDQQDVNEESRARRLALVPGAARIPGPHQPPKLGLIVNAERRLYEAVMANDPRRVATWLARGADPNARDPDGRTALFEAMLTLKDKDAAIAEQLLAGGADVHVRDRDGQTPLHAAATFGDEAHMRVLLEHRAEIDARDAAGQTPLHKAAGLGRVEATTYLVGRGADVAICDHDGRTPLHHVLMDRHLEEHLREPLERLLWGFMTARIVEARQDSLIVRVEGGVTSD